MSGSSLGSLLRAVRNRIRPARRLAGVAYWEERVRAHGRRSVLNLSHPETEYDAVTEMQRGEILPHLRRALRGDERVSVDLGCGPGRFTPDLAELTGGRAIGVDPVASLLELAPAHARVEYRTMQEGVIPVPDAGADLVWICLVLGGLAGPVLARTIREVLRVLRPDGLLFLVENTTEEKSSGPTWTFRSVEAYRSIFPGLPLEHVHDYRDVGERISIFAGRKPL